MSHVSVLAIISIIYMVHRNRNTNIQKDFTCFLSLPPSCVFFHVCVPAELHVCSMTPHHLSVLNTPKPPPRVPEKTLFTGAALIQALVSAQIDGLVGFSARVRVSERWIKPYEFNFISGRLPVVACRGLSSASEQPCFSICSARSKTFMLNSRLGAAWTGQNNRFY